jgi:non-specific serine/threonine protein kinase
MNQDGWSHHKLYTVKNINSKKYAFLTKSSKIPSKLVPDYFEKFIKDIAKSRHKRHGFWSYQTAVRSCNLQLVHDFLKHLLYQSFIWLWRIRFDATKTKTHSEIDLKT